jgi:hypothetical protein
MSELLNARKISANYRRQFLATASLIALIGAGCGASEAEAQETDSSHPLVWIELGGQLTRLDDGQEAFAPDFPNAPSRPSMFSPSQPFERSPLYSIDETAKLSFQPDSSDWVLSASVLYGRSSSNKHVHQQTHPKTISVYFNSYGRLSKDIAPPIAGRFADTNVQSGDQHLVMDFQAGKDVGLGMFGGKDGTSVFNFGVRFAQFSSKSNIALKSNPDWQFIYKYHHVIPGYGFTASQLPAHQKFHSNFANLQSARSFHGIGPSLSWNGSAPLMGNSQGGLLSFDGGLNGAVLFGRQRVRVHHQATGQYHSEYNAPSAHPITYQPAPVNRTRVKSVIVPNAGAFAGLSYRIENFKVSAGYRADMFFAAMDGGIDTRKSENVGFYGPFATISVGIGG